MRHLKKITARKITEGILKGFTPIFTALITGQVFCFFYWLLFGISFPWWEVYIVQLLCFPFFALGIIVYLSIHNKM